MAKVQERALTLLGLVARDDPGLHLDGSRHRKQPRRPVAIAQGGASANRRLAKAGWPQVTKLQLIELYLDRASEAHSALAVLAESRPQDFVLAPTVQSRPGALRRPA